MPLRELLTRRRFVGLGFVLMALSAEDTLAKRRRKRKKKKNKTGTFVDRDCAEFATQDEAQQFYLAAGGPSKDPHGLDSDRDGIAR